MSAEYYVVELMNRVGKWVGVGYVADISRAVDEATKIYDTPGLYRGVRVIRHSHGPDAIQQSFIWQNGTFGAVDGVFPYGGSGDGAWPLSADAFFVVEVMGDGRRWEPRQLWHEHARAVKEAEALYAEGRAGGQRVRIIRVTETQRGTDEAFVWQNGVAGDGTGAFPDNGADNGTWPHGLAETEAGLRWWTAVTLLLLGAVGAWIGVALGQMLFHHNHP